MSLLTYDKTHMLTKYKVGTSKRSQYHGSTPLPKGTPEILAGIGMGHGKSGFRRIGRRKEHAASRGFLATTRLLL